jgi:hypothetical protein
MALKIFDTNKTPITNLSVESINITEKGTNFYFPIVTTMYQYANSAENVPVHVEADNPTVFINNISSTNLPSTTFKTGDVFEYYFGGSYISDSGGRSVLYSWLTFQPYTNNITNTSHNFCEIELTNENFTTTDRNVFEIRGIFRIQNYTDTTILMTWNVNGSTVAKSDPQVQPKSYLNQEDRTIITPSRKNGVLFPKIQVASGDSTFILTRSNSFIRRLA